MAFILFLSKCQQYNNEEIYLFSQNACNVDVFQMEKRNLNGGLEQG